MVDEYINILEEEDDLMFMEDEEPVMASSGGLMQFGRMGLANIYKGEMPLKGEGMVTDMEHRPDPNQRLIFDNALQQSQIARQGYGGTLGGFGRDIMGKVTEKRRGDVDSFLGEVEGMAEDRFDIELDQQQQGISGKGQRPPMMHFDPRMVRAMKEGGRVGVPGMAWGGLPALWQGGSQLVRSGGTSLVPYIPKLPKVFNRGGGNRVPPNVGSKTKKGFPWKKVGWGAGIASLLPFLFGGEDEKIDVPEKDTPPRVPSTKTDDTNTGGGYSLGYIPRLMDQMEKDREALEQSRKRDEGLSMMLAGVKMAERGQLSEASEGIELQAKQNQAYQDALSKSQAMGVQLGVAADTIQQKAQQSANILKAAMQKSGGVSGWKVKDLATARDNAMKTIKELEIQIESGATAEGDALTEEGLARARTLLAEQYQIYRLMDGQLRGLLGENAAIEFPTEENETEEE